MVSLRRTGRTLPRMSNAQRTHVVPLEAGAGPDNPPCPACGEPLFGWLAPQPGLRGPVSRCESCGLGVVGDSAGPEEALQELDRLGAAAPRIANRASFATSLGSAGWAGLEPGVRYLFTVESVRRLVARRDQVVQVAVAGRRGRASPPPGRRCSTASPSATTSPWRRSAAAEAAPADAALAAADRRPRQRRPGDPGAARRDPGRAGRRHRRPRRRDRPALRTAQALAQCAKRGGWPS